MNFEFPTFQALVQIAMRMRSLDYPERSTIRLSNSESQYEKLNAVASMYWMELSVEYLTNEGSQH